MLNSKINLAVISREISAAVFEYSGIAAKRLRAAKPLRHWQRSEKSLESTDSRLKSFLATLEMTTYGFFTFLSHFMDSQNLKNPMF